MTAAAPIADELLRRLSDVSLDDGRVISVYLDLDPSEFATGPARSSEISSVLDEAERAARGADGISHEAQVALREDLQRLERFFAEDFSAEGLGGLAIFASAPAELFEVVPLGRPPGRQVSVDGSPQLAPLLGARDEGRWLVLVVGRREARILRGSADGLHPAIVWSDDVHGRHHQGGWSQARYERSVEQDVAEHLARVADVLARLSRRVAYEHLAVIASPQLWPLLESHLKPPASERLAGHVGLDLDDANRDEVLEAVRPLMQQTERRREHELLERLRDGIGASGRAAGGLEDVLEALVERRVESLLLAPDFAAAGVVCEECGWLGVDAESCPADGASLQRRANIVDDAIAAAIASGAEVLTVRHHEGLGPLGGIAALLRF